MGKTLQTQIVDEIIQSELFVQLATPSGMINESSPHQNAARQSGECIDGGLECVREQHAQHSDAIPDALGTAGVDGWIV